MFGQRLRQLAWVYVAFVGIENTTQNTASGGPIGMHRLDLGGRDYRQVKARRPRHPAQVLKKLHTLGRVSRPDCFGVPVGDRRIRIFGEVFVEVPGVIS